MKLTAILDTVLLIAVLFGGSLFIIALADAGTGSGQAAVSPGSTGPPVARAPSRVELAGIEVTEDMRSGHVVRGRRAPTP